MPNQDPSIAQELLAHQTFLKRLAIDLVGKDADDLVQDVWQRALERPPHHGGQLRGWVARVARNLAANRWRDEARRRSREERQASEQPVVDALEARFELRNELVGALDSLSKPCRETILLRYFEGLAPRDIASHQGVPLATVKTRLRRGLVQLREALDKRYGDDRATWMSAVTGLVAPVESVAGTGTVLIGGVAMGTMMKVSAAVLVAAVCMYFVTKTPRAESPRMAGVESAAADVEHSEPFDAVLVPGAADPASEAGQRSLVSEEFPGGVSSGKRANVLRVILEGLSDEDARMAKIVLTGVDKRATWPAEIRDSWPCQGLTSEFDLGPFLLNLEQHEHLRIDGLEVEVDHPHYLREETRVSFSPEVESTNGKTIHEVRVGLVRPEFWPEFTLAVRDAHTRAHLEDIELRFASGNGNAMWGRNGVSPLLGSDLKSPIALMGGRDAAEPEVKVAGMALRAAPGGSPRLVELTRRFGPEVGVIVSARAPGYAWGSISVDVSKGAEYELLLGPSSTLNVRLLNVQLERYATLEAVPMLCVYKIRADGGNQYVRFERIDKTLMAKGLRLDNLVPDGYRAAVELDGGGWPERPVLASEETSLVVGESRELVLELEAPPAPQERATFGGVVSFPVFGGEEEVRLQLYKADKFVGEARYMGGADLELTLADLVRVGGALPTWSFHLEDLPVGLYQVQLKPFLKSWMIELPPGGAEGVELVIPELAEVLVETVDARTGKRLPVDQIYYRHQEVLSGRVHIDRAKADLEEPGRFRFWTAPGAALIYPFQIPSELSYGKRYKDLELVGGLQSVRLELEPIYAFSLEFRDDGVALARFDELWDDAYSVVQDSLRAVDQKGGLMSLRGVGVNRGEMQVEVSAPGSYEISFEGIGVERYHPIPPRLVDVRAGETTKVIVDLRRK